MTEKVEGVLQSIENAAKGEKTSLQDIMKSMEGRGFGPLFMVPGLLVMLPSGAIPGIPLICGAIICLLGVQMFLGKQPRFPKGIEKAKFDSGKLKSALRKLHPVGKKLDVIFYPRLNKVLDFAGGKLVAATTVILGVLIIVMGFIPFAVILPGLAIVMMSIGVTVKDGLLVSLSIVLVALSLVVSIGSL